MKLNLITVNFSNNALLHKLAKSLVKTLNLTIDTHSLKLEVADTYSPERNQYYSTEVLVKCKKNLQALEGYKILLIDLDIYVPALTYIFGEAELGGEAAIISITRLKPEFYMNQPDPALFFQRIQKEVLHELGHNLGLYHCIDWDCVMHSSNNIDEVDLKGSDYCRKCRQIINRDIVKVF
ncbi:MAG: archaemetzincin family Zn-dependent metalloprotease [Ignavibacteria bacterium]